jgi:hypothetical protein
VFQPVNRESAEPEIVFRIVHVAIDDESPPAAFREQAVEVALGPNAAFSTGNVGTLTRQVPADRVVTGVPSRRGRPRPPREPKTPRLVELLRKATEWRRQLDAGDVPNQAAIAHREGITRARVTQILLLLRLAPDIQERILRLPKTGNPPRISERSLRLVAPLDSCGQHSAFLQQSGSPA